MGCNCPTCKYVITRPAFKKTYDGKMIPTDPDLTCGIMQGLTFQVHDNTYCGQHEPMVDQLHNAPKGLTDGRT